MQDFGASNTEVGHRRTILYPQLQEIGTGDIPFGPSSWASNSLYVFDAHLWDPRPDVRENRDFVAWPPPGYVPAVSVWGRWSFSLARADFSSAAVSVKGPDGPVHVDILERVQSGGLMAPEAAIVFAVDGDTNSAVFETPTNGDECYEVSISGVTMSGSPVDVFSYATCLIDPSQKVESNQSVDRRVTPNPVDAEPASGDTENCLDLRFSAWTTPCWAVGTPQNLPFADVTTSWQLDPVGWMVANDITTGVTPNRFDPNGLVRTSSGSHLHLAHGRSARSSWRCTDLPGRSRRNLVRRCRPLDGGNRDHDRNECDRVLPRRDRDPSPSHRRSVATRG